MTNINVQFRDTSNIAHKTPSEDKQKNTIQKSQKKNKDEQHVRTNKKLGMNPGIPASNNIDYMLN